MLDRRHDHAHPVQRVPDLLPGVCDRDDGRARVGDPRHVGRQRGIDRLQELRRHRRGGGEDQGIEEKRRGRADGEDTGKPELEIRSSTFGISHFELRFLRFHLPSVAVPPNPP